MTKNLTLRLDEGLLHKARLQAVQSRKSLSRWVVDIVSAEVGGRDSYQQACRRALAGLDKGLHLGGKPLSRADIYES
jgi:hypothetical protein